MTQTNKRLGIWAANGVNPNPDLMYKMNPGLVTVINDYLGSNRIPQLYNGKLLVRFMHPKNWHENPTVSARNYANELIQKLEGVDALGAWWYFWNEMNLHYENNMPADQQWSYIETHEFYKKLADWTYEIIDRVKQARPDTKAVMPPFAYGHKEDGAPDDNGDPKIGWAGYDYFADMIKSHFGGIITGHYYWGDGGGTRQEWLYGPANDWYAFRWKRVFNLFNKRYGYDPYLIIDECGNFDPTYPTFPDDMIYYAQECLSHPRVLGVTPFLWADPTGDNAVNDWQRIPNLEQFVDRIANTTFVAEPQIPPQPTLPPEVNTMWHKDFINNAIEHYRQTGNALSDADEYGITINKATASTGQLAFRVVGIHKLTCDENHRDHNVYGDVVDQDGNRMNDYLVRGELGGDKNIIFSINKPDNEPGGNAPLFKGNVVNNLRVLSVNDEYPSDTVSGITTDHPDECDGNTRFHFSFYVVWQLVAEPAEETPPPDEQPEPTPAQPADTDCNCESFVGKLLMKLVKALFC